MNKIITAIILLLAFSFPVPLVFSQSNMTQEMAIDLAKEYIQSQNMVSDIKHLQNPQAVYMLGENAWIIEFSDKQLEMSADAQVMLRVQATSGRSPQILNGSQKQRYASYFGNSTK